MACHRIACHLSILAVTALRLSAQVDTRPDLLAHDVEVPDANCQDLRLQGIVQVAVTNIGQSTAPSGFEVLVFEDRNANALFDPHDEQVIGRSLVTQDVLPSATVQVGALVEGDVTFLGSPVGVWVDSSDAISETDELNNVASSSQECGTSVLILRDEFFFDSRSDFGGRGVFVLEAGRQYVMEVLGTYNGWPAVGYVCGSPEPAPIYPSPDVANGFVGADAAYAFTTFQQDLCADLPFPIIVPTFCNNFQLMVSAQGGWQVFPVAPQYRPSHVYSYSIIGAGEPLQVRLCDVFYPDNYGAFRVRVFEDVSNAAAAGRVLITSDEWLLSNTGFASAPTDTNRYAQNLAAWFTGGMYGNFLAYSTDFSLTGSSLAAAMSAAHTWTVSTAVPFDLAILSEYDAVLFAGPPAPDLDVLTQYVLQGGGVYIHGGTSVPATAAEWNPFLAQFGLRFGATENGVGGNLPISSEHPVLAGVGVLYHDNGQDVFDLDASDPANAILATYNGVSLFAAYEPAQGPPLSDLSASLVSLAGSCAGSIFATVRVGNGGAVVVPAEVPVLFSSPEVSVLGISETTRALAPGEFEDVSIFVESSLPAGSTVCAAVDDDGSGVGLIDECREDNNTCSATLEIPDAAVTLEGLSPQQGAQVRAGQVVTVSGRAVSREQGIPVAAVTVNGTPVDALDAQGHFFKQVTVGEGPNQFLIGALNHCGESLATVEIEGLPAGGSFDQFSEVTGQIRGEFLHAPYREPQVVACNDGDGPVAYPILMVFDEIIVGGRSKTRHADGTGTRGPHKNASVEIANADGYTEDGKPYIVFSGNGDIFLQGGDCSDSRVIFFDNPERVSFTYRLRWLAAQNRAPYFSSIPALEGTAGRPYRYGAVATDPEGESLLFELEIAPSGMAVDSVSGAVEWAPTPDDAGTHAVRLAATDGQGGRATQVFVLDVAEARANRPPYFTSTPVVQLPLGAQYRYQAAALDPDADPAAFSKVDGPSDLSVTPAGLVEWTTTIPGVYPVEVQVADGEGGTATQAYAIASGGVSSNPSGPVLFGVPPTEVVIGQLFFFQPSAFDPDGGPLAFSLTGGGERTTLDPVSGRITWVPLRGQEGFYPLELTATDDEGASASISWPLEVVEAPDNRPPVIVSIPPIVTAVNEPYQYSVIAVDPEERALSFELFMPQPGMSIDPVTGVLAWTPNEEGRFTVAVKAIDPEGGVGSQVYFLTVRGPNNAPTMTSAAPTRATVGSSYFYDANATDLDGDLLHWSLSQAPQGMSISEATGLVSWRPTSAQVGAHPVVIRVVDGFGGEDTEAFVLDAARDTGVPTVSIVFSQQPLLVGDTVQVCVHAGDDVDVVSTTLSVDRAPLDLDTFGCALFAATETGDLEFFATATDSSGNTGVALATLSVRDLGDVPVVEILSPEPGSTITAPMEIRAQILKDDQANPVLDWSVRLERLATGESRLLAEGSGEVDGTVALLDTTLLPNDTWRLLVFAGNGVNDITRDAVVEVAGEYKLGNFSVSFTDLTIPIAGIPIVVTREYNSLDTTPGEFGNGWRLGLPGRVCDTPKEGTGETFKVETKVYVTRSDGRRVGFTLQYIPLSFWFPFFGNLRFVPDDGVFDSLKTEADPIVVLLGDSFYSDIFTTSYNPDRYVFTTKERVEYLLSESDGLQRITDPNGNTTEVTEDGLFSSLGPAVVFERDAANRIQRIIEPDDPTDNDAPGELNYTYDKLGNLETFQDQLGHVTRYAYTDKGFPRHLTSILDPLNRPVIRNVFDDDGRLLAQCNADGDINPPYQRCRVFEFDPLSPIQTQTIIDAKGNRLDLVVDSRGHVLLERRHMSDGTTQDTARVYDADGNMREETDPEGNTTIFTYDDRGNLLTRTDPGGRTWTYAYNECNKVASECDPTGSCTTYEYDERCNLTAVVDALGHRTRFEYDPGTGQLTDFLDKKGANWHLEYEGAFPISLRDPYNETAEFGYNDLGELRFVVDRADQRIDYTYDGTHRLTHETWDDGRVITYQYNGAGQLEEAFDPDSHLVMTYYPTGLLWTVDNTGTPGMPSVVLTYEYDANGNTTAVVDSMGGRTEYLYDAANRMTRALQTAAPGPAPALDKRVYFDRNRAGLVERIRRYADLAETQGVFTTDFSYDCSGCPQRVTGIHHRRSSDGTTINHFTYLRDSAGRIRQLSDSEGLHIYTLDALGQILAVDHPSGGAQPDEFYNYDAMGNRLTSHLSAFHNYAGAPFGSRLQTDAIASYEYNANGQLVRMQVSSGELDAYTYDLRGRLTAASRYTPSGAVQWTQEYVYDLLNRRIRENEDDTSRFRVYDGRNAVLLLSTSSEPHARRLYGRGLDEYLAEDREAEIIWPVQDNAGTVHDVWTHATGVIRHVQYDTFGTVVDTRGTALDASVGFQGRERSANSGLMDFRARAYSTHTGRMISEDRIMPFGYVAFQNQPTNMRDPLGLTELPENAFLLAVDTALYTATYIGCVYYVVIAFSSAIGAQEPSYEDIVPEFGDLNFLDHILGGLACVGVLRLPGGSSALPGF